MKVPRDPDNPTHTDTFKIGFWRFLRTDRATRTEYLKRRQQATLNDQRARSARIDEWADGKRAQSAARKADKQTRRAGGSATTP